jgi:hypothetical protein
MPSSFRRRAIARGLMPAAKARKTRRKTRRTISACASLTVLAPDRLALRVGVLHHVVAVAEPAAGLALFDPAADAAMRLGGEVLEEQRIHRAFEADMQFGDLALAQGDDLHAGDRRRLWKRERGADACELGSAAGVGEESEVADATELVR